MPFNVKHLLYILVYVVTGTAQSVLTKKSLVEETPGSGKFVYSYDPAAATFCVGLVKIFFTVVYLLFFQHPDQSISFICNNLLRRISVARNFAIPAALYFGFDVLAFFNLSLVQPATFRLLINIKVLFSGLLLQIIIGTRLSARQWLALIILLLACCVEQMDSFDINTGMLAIVCICAQALCSSCAGVYFQFLLQRSKDGPSTGSSSGGELGLWEKNLFMYFWSITFNIFYLFIFRPRTFWHPVAAAQTLDLNVLPIIVFSAIGGLSTSLILRDMDVIMKEYANFAEMSVATKTTAQPITYNRQGRCLVVFSSWLVLNSAIHVTLIIAILMVTGSLYLYNVPASTPTASFSTERSKEKETSKEGLELTVHRGTNDTATGTDMADEHERAGLLQSNGEAAG